MTLQLAYQGGLVLTTAFAMLAVLLGGELPGIAWMAVLALPLTIACRRYSQLNLNPLGAAVLVLGLFGAAFGALFRGETIVATATLVILSLLAARLIRRSQLAQDRQALLLSVLLVFAGSILHTDITYGVIFILYAIAAVWALVTQQLVAGILAADPQQQQQPNPAALQRRDVVTPTYLAVTAGLAVTLLLATAILFALFPRIGIGRLGFLSSGRGGLPSTVSLGQVPISGNGEVVARVEGLDQSLFDNGLYLRGPVYSKLRRDGFARAALDPLEVGDHESRVPDSASYNYAVYMVPVSGKTLLTLGPFEQLDIVAGGSVNPSAKVRVGSLPIFPEAQSSVPLTGPLRLMITGPINRVGHLPENYRSQRLEEKIKTGLQRYTEVPQDLDPRIEQLLRGLLLPSDDFAIRAGKIERYLRTGFSYTTQAPNAATTDPLASFLFADKRGHCEYFATAHALLLRKAGVPARVVGGFQGGFWDQRSKVAVFTNKNAHSWVEWYLPGAGWITADSTPMATNQAPYMGALAALWDQVQRSWDDYIVEYSLQTQLAMVDQLRSQAVGPAGYQTTARQLFRNVIFRITLAVVALLAMGAFLIHRWLKYRRFVCRESALGKQLRITLEKLLGRPLEASETAREALGLLPGASIDKDLLQLALVTYECEKFGEQPPGSTKQVADMIRSLRRLRSIKIA